MKVESTDQPTGTRTYLTYSEYERLTDQQRRVYDYLCTGKGLSNLLALTNLAIGSLSTRIAELRKKGLEIVSEHRINPVNSRRYVVYRLTPAQEEASPNAL